MFAKSITRVAASKTSLALRSLGALALLTALSTLSQGALAADVTAWVTAQTNTLNAVKTLALAFFGVCGIGLAGVSIIKLYKTYNDRQGDGEILPWAVGLAAGGALSSLLFLVNLSCVVATGGGGTCS